MFWYRIFPFQFSLVFGIIVASAALCFFKCGVDGQGILPWPTETSTSPTSTIADEAIVQFRMNGAQPTTDNATVCTGFQLRDTSQFWIIQIAGVADWSKVHHLGLYGCDHVITTGSACSCGMANRSPIYAWSRYTNTVRFTGNNEITPAGFRVGGTTDKQFLFIETHYHGALSAADYTSGIDIHITRTTSYIAIRDLMIYSIMSKGTISKNTTQVFLDACVTVPDVADNNIPGLQFIGHQAHSHNMGRLVSAYIVTADGLKGEIGRGNPVWPQVYRTSGVPYTTADGRSNFMSPGDKIYSRCYYTSAGVPFDVSTIGVKPKTTWTEMCMSNILVVAYYSEYQLVTKGALLTGTCTAADLTDFNTKFPQSKELLPDNPVLDAAAVNGGNTNVVTLSNGYKVNLGTETFTDFF